MSSVVKCYECNQELRRDCLFTHIKKEHPDYFYKELFAFQNDSECSLKSPTRVRDAIHILSGEIIPYDMGDDDCIDFGSGKLYKDKTAVTKIGEHPLKHRQKYYESIMEGMTIENLILLFQVLLKKPSIIYKDEAVIEKYKKTNESLQKELKETTHELNSKIRELYMSDDKQEIEELTIRNIKLTNEIDNMRFKMNEMASELKHYRDEEEYRMEQNQSRFIEDMKQDSYVDQSRKWFDKEIAKMKKELQAEKDKVKSLEKIKKKNKSLKKYIDMLKRKGDSDDSDDSDSDSD